MIFLSQLGIGWIFHQTGMDKNRILTLAIPVFVHGLNDLFCELSSMYMESLCFFSRGMNFRLFTTTPEGTEYDLGAYDQNAANLSGTDIGLSYHVVSLRSRILPGSEPP